MQANQRCLSDSKSIFEHFFKATTVSQQSGFTLLEMMVVITITGVLIVIASGDLLSVRAGEQVRSASESMRSVMATSRMKALTKGQKQYVGIDFTSETFTSTLYDEDAYAAGGWAESATWKKMEGVNLIPSKANGSAKKNPNTGVMTISFSPRGTAAADGSVLIKNASHPSSNGKIIVLNKVTGRVRIDDCTASCQ